MADTRAEIAGAPALAFAYIDSRCQWTKRCLHHQEDGRPLGPAQYLAICRVATLYYLFGCNAQWQPLTETRHDSLENAQHQAEFEYEGITQCWTQVDPVIGLPGHSPSNSRSFLSSPDKEVSWRGNPYIASGYGKMSREIVLRLSHLTRLGMWSPHRRDTCWLSEDEQCKLDQLRTIQVSDSATLVRALPPQMEHLPGKRICFTMMETQTIHADFIRRLNTFYHECWTPTRWNREAFLTSGIRIPVHVVPLGVDPDVFNPGLSVPLPEAELLTTTRAGVKESPQGFIYITAYQPTFRKGIPVLLEAFEAAFENDPEAALVLATTFHPLSQLENDLSDNSMNARVYSLKGRFSESGLADIFRSSNAYVSSSLGEGWNLPLCEAAACGLPVIAPQHSAHAELLSHDIAYLYPPDGYSPVKGSERISPWFEGQTFARYGNAAIEHLTTLLKTVKSNYSVARGKGAAASRYFRSNLTWDMSVRQVLARLVSARNAI